MILDPTPVMLENMEPLHWDSDHGNVAHHRAILSESTVETVPRHHTFIKKLGHCPSWVSVIPFSWTWPRKSHILGGGSRSPHFPLHPNLDATQRTKDRLDPIIPHLAFEVAKVTNKLQMCFESNVQHLPCPWASTSTLAHNNWSARNLEAGGIGEPTLDIHIGSPSELKTSCFFKKPWCCYIIYKYIIILYIYA